MPGKRTFKLTSRRNEFTDYRWTKSQGLQCQDPRNKKWLSSDYTLKEFLAGFAGGHIETTEGS